MMASSNINESHKDDSSELSGSESFSEESDYASTGYSYEAEWADHINEDGSVLYIESYMSSTVREKQEQAMRSQTEKKAMFPTNNKQIKKENRLLGLLKRRPSIRMKKSELSTAEDGIPKNTNESSPLKVTFRDNPSGEVRTVQLYVSEHNLGLGRRASLCEIVLGVVPGRFGEAHDTRVMVAGLVPGSQALQSGVIKIGDWLKEVNERPLSLDNFDTILQTIQVPSLVTVTVQKCASETLPHQDDQNNKRMIQTNLVKLIADSDHDSSSRFSNGKKLKALPHTVLYLSLSGVSEHDPDGADIRYQFPNWSNKLVCVRGMFITIAHTVQESVGGPALRSSILIDEEYYHVAYYREDNDVFLMALPHSCVSEYEIVAHMEHLTRLLKFEFGTISNALINPQNKNYIDHLLSMMLGDILSSPKQPVFNATGNIEGAKNVYYPLLSKCSNQGNCGVVLQAPSLLLLNDTNVKLQIDNCLSELEAGDFGDENFDCDQYEMLYSIIGTCLFYKRHLIGSHVTGTDLNDMWWFASLHGLLHLVSNEAVSQLVCWKQVYPQQTENLPDSDIKYYILYVAMNHMLLGMLVEAGNITELLDDMLSGPDPILVDQIETTLYELHGFHIHNFCEESLTQGGIESKIIDHNFKPSTFKKLLKQSFSEPIEVSKTPDVPSILKQRTSPLPELYVHQSGLKQDNYGGETSDDTHSSIESPSLHNDQSLTDQESLESDWQLWKSKEGYEFDQGHSVGLPKSPVYPFSVTVGKEKVLFHLVHLDKGEGFIIEALSSQTEESMSLYPQLADNFKAACERIHHVLHASQRNKDSSGNYVGNNMLNGINEHGIMFSMKPSQLQSSNSSTKYNNQAIQYWVIGKLIGGTHQSEIYVCYDDRIPQNVQEMAYKLAMGTYFL